jgi:hypothetical protein
MQVLTVFLSRLIQLVLTLPVSTTTTERAFSTMKLVKTRLRKVFLKEVSDHNPLRIDFGGRLT